MRCGRLLFVTHDVEARRVGGNIPQISAAGALHESVASLTLSLGVAETPSGWCAVLRKSVQLSDAPLTSSFHPLISGIKAGGSGVGGSLACCCPACRAKAVRALISHSTALIKHPVGVWRLHLCCLHALLTSL